MVEWITVAVQDVSVCVERPKHEQSRLINRVFSSDAEKQREVEKCLICTFITANVSYLLLLP
jgi:hypothetical protein